MMRELGAVRLAMDSLIDTPRNTTPEAADLRHALDHASEAVHDCIDTGSDRAVKAAWLAIAQAKDMARRVSPLIAAAQRQREAARDIRSHAARQREAARRWRRAQALMGPGSDEEPAPEADDEDVPDEDDDQRH